MRQKEQRLWDAMRRNKPSGFWLQRVENIVVDGMPDLFVIADNGAISWVELKATSRPARPTTKFIRSSPLRPSQINWHLKAATYDARTYILIRDDQRQLYLVGGAVADTINDWPLEMADDFMISGWDELWEALR